MRRTSFLAFVATCALAVCSTAHAQLSQAGSPITQIWSQVCNNGLGGSIGQTYNGVLCVAPTGTIPYSVPATNHSGAVPIGGQWYEAAPAEPGRVRFQIQNYYADMQGIATAENLCWLLSPTQPIGTPAANGCFELGIGGWFDNAGTVVIGSEPMWVWAATSGHQFELRTFVLTQ